MWCMVIVTWDNFYLLKELLDDGVAFKLQHSKKRSKILFGTDSVIAEYITVETVQCYVLVSREPFKNLMAAGNTRPFGKIRSLGNAASDRSPIQSTCI